MNNSSGTVLLMVLILSAIMYLIAGTLLLVTMTEVHLADFEQRSTQAFYAAESSVTLGLAKLRTDPDYRTDASDTTSIGANTGLLNAQFYDGTNDGNGHFRKSLAPSLYRLVIRGTGSVPGLDAAARRTVEREVVLKPFALFAQATLTLAGGCTIKGNVHGNVAVTIEIGSTVTGDVTSQSSSEPPITLPGSPISLYFPKYWYNGAEYDAQPLTHDTVTLSPAGGVDPPAPAIEVYSGFPTSDNPAGVFYPDSEISGSLVALQVQGTVIIPSPQNLSLTGAVTITPVANFPALIGATDLTLMLMGNLEIFSASLEKSRIQGLIYAKGDLAITGNDAPGEMITGSILGRNIMITGNPIIQVKYDPAVMSNPPPGIDLIELGEWREVFE